MKKTRFWLVMPITLLATLFITACEESEDERVAAAQQCLNEMNSSMSSDELATKAAECRSALGEVTSQKGFMVECSSYFLEEGFFGSQILEAFDRVGDDSNSDNDVLNMVSTFAFDSLDNANAAQESCAQSGVTVYEVFGDLAQMATTIGDLGGLTTSGEIPTLEEFEAALANIDSDAEFEALGESVVSLAETLCSEDSADFSEEACPTLNAVTSATDSTTIGECLKECMEGSSTTCSADSSIQCP